MEQSNDARIKFLALENEVINSHVPLDRDAHTVRFPSGLGSIDSQFQVDIRDGPFFTDILFDPIIDIAFPIDARYTIFFKYFSQTIFVD